MIRLKYRESSKVLNIVWGTIASLLGYLFA